jgi:hypothetical protein
LPMPTSPAGGATPAPGLIPALPPPPVAPPGGLPAHGKKTKSGSGKAAVDMDWDDEDESTHVYDKQPHDGVPNSGRPVTGPVSAPKVSAAAALLANSGGAAPAVRTAATAAMANAASASAQPASRAEEQTGSRNRTTVASTAAGGSRAGVILGGLSLIVVSALAVFVLLPKKGQLQVVVTAPGGAAVGKVEIFVDGQKKCDTTPCLVKDLEPGSRIIKGIAPDYPPVEISVNVEGNKEKMVPLELKGAASAPSASSVPAGATELKIASVEAQKGVKVSVDGTDKGTLPVELRDLSPGPHKLKFDGGERFDKLEQSVDLSAGQSKDLGAIKLKVLKGQVTLELATAGANVTLVRRGSDNKNIEKKLPDLSKAPVTMEIEPSENWKLLASKKGYPGAQLRRRPGREEDQDRALRRGQGRRHRSEGPDARRPRSRRRLGPRLG